MLTSSISAVGFMVMLGLALAGVLVVANRLLSVDEDPRIDAVENMLPHANCGACGTAGCRAFAEKLVQGELQPAKCTVNSAQMNGFIADFLGVDVGHEVKRVARLACAGGNHVAQIRASYSGTESCRAAALVSGGGKGCTWGCLGFGDCADVCEFDAIAMDEHSLPVVDTGLCTACGDCVAICPRELFSLHPVDHQLWVACKSLDEGDAAESECEVVCTACGRCAQDAPDGMIRIENNLAVVDYSKNRLASPLIIDRCPTGAIVWLDDKAGTEKGKASKSVFRHNPLPMSNHHTL